MDNYSKPVLPDNPIRYVEEHNDRIVTLMLMMTHVDDDTFMYYV